MFTADEIAQRILLVAHRSYFDVQGTGLAFFCENDRTWNVQLLGQWVDMDSRMPEGELETYTFTAWIENDQIHVEF